MSDRTSYLTRHDPDVGDGDYDSIAWALEVHVAVPDTGEYRAAVLHGDEDAPERIEFWRAEEPMRTEAPDFVWIETNRGHVGIRERGTR